MKYKLPPLPTLILLLVVFTGIFVYHYLHPEKKFKFPQYTTGIGKKSTNTSKQWHCSFTYLDGSVQGWVTAGSDQSRLILSSNLEEGKIVYQLYDHTGSLHYSFLVGNPTDTLQVLLNAAKGMKSGPPPPRRRGVLISEWNRRLFWHTTIPTKMDSHITGIANSCYF